MLKRLRNYLNKESLVKVANSLFNSKIRYGVQLFGKIRWEKQDPANNLLTSVQLIQNKMIRWLNGVNLSDKINTKILLANCNMLSLNQMNAQVKLMEMWKAVHVEDYPLKIKVKTSMEGVRSTRSVMSGSIVEQGKSTVCFETFKNDAARAWNKAPNEIKECKSLYSVKKCIRKFVSTLPI